MVLTHRHSVKSAAGLTEVLVRWRNFELVSGLMAVLAHRRDVKSAVELTSVLSCCLLAQ